nr:cell division control protein 2 homolog D [Ipomoea batatas]
MKKTRLQEDEEGVPPTTLREISLLRILSRDPHIVRLLGTPNEQVWPGVSKLVNWHEYPQWKPQPLSSSVPNLDENGLNLLAEMLHYEPSRRISAKKAMEHPYFDDLDKSITEFKNPPIACLKHITCFFNFLNEYCTAIGFSRCTENKTCEKSLEQLLHLNASLPVTSARMKPNDERVALFRRNLLVLSGELDATIDSPKCSLCSELESTPTVNYIACELCGGMVVPPFFISSFKSAPVCATTPMIRSGGG